MILTIINSILFVIMCLLSYLVVHIAREIKRYWMHYFTLFEKCESTIYKLKKLEENAEKSNEK